MRDEAIYYSRMALGIYKFLRMKPHPDPEAVIRHQFENREPIFLDTARQVVFSNPRNPYHEMFRLAGCTFGDLERAVKKDGLEAALEAVHRQGVYLTHDEFKRKMPIVRSGREIPSPAGCFRNPLFPTLIGGVSSGSRSKGTTTTKCPEYVHYRVAWERLYARELGLEGRARVEVRAILPSFTGLGACLRSAARGERVERWFAVGGSLRDSGHYRALTGCMVGFGNLVGGSMPLPTYIPPNDFAPVAEWIARRRAEGVGCFVGCVASPAVRIATAALDGGLDIRDTVFRTGGEALTDAKRAVIESTGSRVYPLYPNSEIGTVGCSCRQMTTGNCVHIFRDRLAVIGHRRRAPLTDTDVDDLLFTTLLPFTPHVLINVSMDDGGVIEPAHCDCLFSRMGFTTQVRDIASFGKLTGQGMTLVGTDMVRILEEVLPARLGGAPGDYQLVEHEGAAQTQITLRVSPRTGVVSSEKVKECFLSELRRFYGGSLAARMWSHAEGVDVVLAEPLAGRTGKVLSLYLLGSGMEKRHAT